MPEASFGPIICRYVFLFISYFLTNHAGSRRPTMASKGYIFLIISHFLTNHAGPRRPTTAGQRRSTKAHSSQQRPTKANKDQQRPTETKKGPNDARHIVWAVGVLFLILFFYFIDNKFP